MPPHPYTYFSMFTIGPGPGGDLITNDAGHKTEDFKRLYFMRWGVECSYLLLKNRFQLENFTGKTENTLKQDFWATILASTMLMVLEEDVDEQIRKEREDKGNRYEYQVNRNNVNFAQKFYSNVIRAVWDADYSEIVVHPVSYMSFTVTLN